MWREAIAKDMSTYDEVMSGKRPAYEGFIMAYGARHGPVQGVLVDDVVDGITVRRLQLEGPLNTRITMVPTTPRQPGAFVVQLPTVDPMSCDHCLDPDATELPLAAALRFDFRADVHVRLRRLSPSEIDVPRAKALFPFVLGEARPDGGELVSSRYYHDPFVTFPRPPQVDPRYGSCEMSLAKPADLRVSSACPSTWRVGFPTAAVQRKCCTRPRYHGPSTSGFIQEDCVDLR